MAQARAAALPTPEPLQFKKVAPSDAVAINAAVRIAQVPNPAAQAFLLRTASADDYSRSLSCLTAAVYYEARSESFEGQRAVAQVVLNRVRHPAFPKSVCGVVYQGSHRRTGCQFSFTCDGSLRARRDPASWARARRVAGAALAGSVYGPVGHATHYHASYVQPWWAASLTRAVTVGTHIFYRWRGDWGDPKSFRRPYLGAEVASPSARPVRPERQAARSGQAMVEDEVTVAHGVTVRRGGPPPRFLAEAQAAEPVHLASAGGVRIHSGLPDFAQAEPVQSEEPAAAAPAS